MQSSALPKLGLLYLDHVLRFFDKSNFKGWPNQIETVTYHWGNDKERFIREVRNKKIDVLIGNIPATAYETFRDIARELPDVTFMPSMDAQFSNKSKENVTHFCHKYDLPVPKTRIFYAAEQAWDFLEGSTYPKIIKRSYGPSNYGGYYVHKVDSFQEAHELLSQKGYFPAYVQDFVKMKADIRVMLIGHSPVCAFWRRPPEGEWLTNTSQGGSIDYSDVPEEVLRLATESSKAANAEYWACDIAVDENDQYCILECATAFAAFPYIRDWIGQYLMWKLSNGAFSKPHIPLYNWEELGKISSSLLRTMRQISFSSYSPSQDSADTFLEMSKNNFPILPTERRNGEEWPSEIWNRQVSSRSVRSRGSEQQRKTDAATVAPGSDESSDEFGDVPSNDSPLTAEALQGFLRGIKGIGEKLSATILEAFDTAGLVETLDNEPEKLLVIPRIRTTTLEQIRQGWIDYRHSLSR
ncbi:ATP-grasp domain-containing protein [Halomonas maura]|uniref:ATP-grasp domain-containing protein n=1 Tax=Halomonas maura TaxID=117606 RepID=UPI0025B42BD7|nr:hypothetical protein [Halomonas maura]MDN3556520.1 hypothetical protein [Halomonas maura]